MLRKILEFLKGRERQSAECRQFNALHEVCSEFNEPIEAQKTLQALVDYIKAEENLRLTASTFGLEKDVYSSYFRTENVRNEFLKLHKEANDQLVEINAFSEYALDLCDDLEEETKILLKKSTWESD